MSKNEDQLSICDIFLRINVFFSPLELAKKPHTGCITICIVFVAMLMQINLQSQTVVTIPPGQGLYISPGTIVSLNGLSLTPTNAFTLDGVDFNIASTVNHPTTNNYVSKVYRFSANAAAFNGLLRLQYNDGLLNGTTEENLKVVIHNNVSWTAYNTAAADVTGNYVEALIADNRTLNEIILSDQFSVLPLHWGAVTAQRSAGKVVVVWYTEHETNVSHFDLERSVDAQNWATIVTNIPAKNSGLKEKYIAIDKDYSPLRLFYRVRQTDDDGKYTYSTVVGVLRENDNSAIQIYPNPVTNSFRIKNVISTDINRIDVFSNNGALVRTWIVAQPAYTLSNLPSGIYHVVLQTRDGRHIRFKINKQ